MNRHQAVDVYAERLARIRRVEILPDEKQDELVRLALANVYDAGERAGMAALRAEIENLTGLTLPTLIGLHRT